MAKNQEAATHCHSIYMRYHYRVLMFVSADLVKVCAIAMHLNIQVHIVRARLSLCKRVRFRDEVMDGTVSGGPA